MSELDELIQDAEDTEKGAKTPETDAEDLIINCDGDTKEALKHLQKVQENILDQVHAIQGFEAYKEHKKEVEQ